MGFGAVTMIPMWWSIRPGQILQPKKKKKTVPTTLRKNYFEKKKKKTRFLNF
jgi:hypothetical protein